MTYFVDVIQLDDVIEEAVEVVKERYNLHRRTHRTHGGETHNVREEDGHQVVTTWFH